MDANGEVPTGSCTAATRGARSPSRWHAAGFLLVALAFATLVWLGSETAHATFPGENGRIAFERGGLMWAMNPDGSDQTRLTCEADFDADQDGWPASSPVWSPDGQRIAFERHDGWRTTLVYVINADGTGQRDVAFGFNPVWSPDDQRIAYHSYTVPGSLPLQIGVVTADGEYVTPEFPGDDPLDEGNNSPAWSPDGQRIAFVHPAPPELRARTGSDIWVMNADGSEQANLTESPTVGTDGPAWSPDGQRIAFWRPDGVWVMNVDGGDQTLVAAAGRWPAWSPDGRQITFLRDIRRIDPQTRLADIWVMNPDGSGQARLARGATAHRPADAANIGSRRWSPDGQRIAFARNGDVWAMNADGTLQTNLTRSRTQDSAPDWQRRPSPPDADPPPRQFCFGPVRRNTNQGIARLVVHVPQPGRVVLQRRPGVKRFVRLHEAAGPGRVVLWVRPRGKPQRRLARAGRTERRVQLPVRVQVSFRPRVGEPMSKGRRMWLVRVGRR
jgi:Tol biopolymer transport system component